LALRLFGYRSRWRPCYAPHIVTSRSPFMPVSLVPVLSPQGHLRLDTQDEHDLIDAAATRRLAASFERGAGHGLLQLGAGEARSTLAPSLAWWRSFAIRYVAAMCGRGQDAAPASPAAPSAGELAALIDAAPPMQGGEYLGAGVLESLWQEMDSA